MREVVDLSDLFSRTVSLRVRDLSGNRTRITHDADILRSQVLLDEVLENCVKLVVQSRSCSTGSL